MGKKRRARAQVRQLSEVEMKAGFDAQDNPDNEHLSEYWCEVCDKKEILTELESIQQGWDYPPHIGVWGVVSPRTCGDCSMMDTAYWAIITAPDKENLRLSEKHLATCERIMKETSDE